MSAKLKRELSLFDAVMMGLGSILGTGIFVSLGLAAGVAGPSVLLAIVIAAFLATFNALSAAQLAAAHPVSGGTYEYAYRFLNPSAGVVAGWMFLLAKSASAATAALGFSGYFLSFFGIGFLPHTLLALVLVTALTALTASGIKRSSQANILIVSVTIFSLLLFAFAGIAWMLINGKAPELRPFFIGETSSSAMSNLFTASALVFVAFTGYGRIATLAEEVKNPASSIPRAVIITLVITLLLYMLVAFSGVGVAGSQFLADATRDDAAPLESVSRLFGNPLLTAIVAFGAITAMVGVLLNLILGLSRVVLAMGRRADLPKSLSIVDGNSQNPINAILLVGIIIGLLTLIGDVRLTWSFSAMTVLIYYSLTNLSALSLPKSKRLFPRWVSWAGLGTCLFLVFWIDAVILIGVGLMILFIIAFTSLKSK